MTESTGTQQKEKVAKAKHKPERESIPQRTFASARHNTPGSDWLEDHHHGGGLLQRQCACGQHMIAGGECEACRQKREATSWQRPAVKPGSGQALPIEPAEVQTFSDIHASHNFNRIPARTVTLQTRQIIQAHLTVNAPGDQYEQEADRVADTVMRMPAPAAGQPFEAGDGWLNQPATINRLPAISRLQASSEGVPAVSSQLEAQIQQMQGGGQSLPTEERAFFETRMGYDFSGVRVHTNDHAVQTSRDLQARAFTMGNNIAFNAGEYQPGTEAGRRLMAHELTHVVQQGATRGSVARSHFQPVLGSAMARQASSPLLQRACGRSGIGVGVAGCAGLSGEPVGETILFKVNCDEFLTTAEQEKVEAFAASMDGTDRVKVHGFASVDGNPDYNDDLSCARAHKAAAVLGSKSIPSSQIDLFKHGPTPGVARERRSVVLERDPPLSRPVPSLSVDRIDIVDSSTGAIGGYPAIVGNASLNTPGPFNDSATGECRNTHQIHFHLDNGSSADLTPTRELQRSAFRAGTERKNPPDQVMPPGVAGPPAAGGFDGVIVGPDGPPPHEIQRPSTDKIVIADSPGSLATPAADHPFIYRSHFSLTVADPGGINIARIKYDVRIEKKDTSDIPNTENTIFATEKVDLVRNRNLL